MKIIITVDGGLEGKELLESLKYDDMEIKREYDEWVGRMTMIGSKLLNFVRVTMIDKIIDNPVLFSLEMINDE